MEVHKKRMGGFFRYTRILRSTMVIVLAKKDSIADLRNSSSGCPQWNVDFSIAAQDWELDADIEFCTLLYSP